VQPSASVCASEKGKPVVRRGRGAWGPLTCWEVAGLPRRAAGQQSSATGERQGRMRLGTIDILRTAPQRCQARLLLVCFMESATSLNKKKGS
jgi:hypothetical protein